MTLIRDNDTSVIRGPAIMQAGWLDSNETGALPVADMKSQTSGV